MDNEKSKMKKQWIFDYMRTHQNEFIDIVSEPFVLAYVKEFQPNNIEWDVYGAPKVPEIGKLLAELYKDGKVDRYRHVCDAYRDGYPKWFYVYYLPQNQDRDDTEELTDDDGFDPADD